MDEERWIVTAVEAGVYIQSLRDVSEALNACVGADGVLLTEADLGPDFFQLRTGVAGELFQKFTNYRLPIALVIADGYAYGERFGELTREHRRHNLIRFVHSEEEGRAWLLTLPARRGG
jgi:hypothetical protein